MKKLLLKKRSRNLDLLSMPVSVNLIFNTDDVLMVAARIRETKKALV